MYLDSGIIVKLLIREPDSDYFDGALAGHVLDSSELCLTEVCSALLAKERAGGITMRERKSALEQFQRLLQEQLLRLYPVNTRVFQRAASILQACHPKVALRTLDALHVASCDIHACDLLCATDQRMRAAAGQLGIRVFPESFDEIRL